MDEQGDQGIEMGTTRATQDFYCPGTDTRYTLQPHATMEHHDASTSDLSDAPISQHIRPPSDDLSTSLDYPTTSEGRLRVPLPKKQLSRMKYCSCSIALFLAPCYSSTKSSARSSLLSTGM
jgi:hypothetical protein